MIIYLDTDNNFSGSLLLSGFSYKHKPFILGSTVIYNEEYLNVSDTVKHYKITKNNFSKTIKTQHHNSTKFIYHQIGDSLEVNGPMYTIKNNKLTQYLIYDEGELKFEIKFKRGIHANGYFIEPGFKVPNKVPAIIKKWIKKSHITDKYEEHILYNIDDDPMKYFLWDHNMVLRDN